MYFLGRKKENRKMFYIQMWQKLFQAGPLAGRFGLSLTVMSPGKSLVKGHNPLDAEVEGCRRAHCPSLEQQRRLSHPVFCQAARQLPQGKHCFSQRSLHSQNSALPYTYLFPNFIPVPQEQICLFHVISASGDIIHNLKN